MNEQEIIRQLQEGTGYTFIKLIDNGRYYTTPYKKREEKGELYATITIDVEDEEDVEIIVKVSSVLEPDFVVSIVCSNGDYDGYDLVDRFKEVVRAAKRLEEFSR